MEGDCDFREDRTVERTFRLGGTGAKINLVVFEEGVRLMLCERILKVESEQERILKYVLTEVVKQDKTRRTRTVNGYPPEERKTCAPFVSEKRWEGRPTRYMGTFIS